MNTPRIAPSAPYRGKREGKGRIRIHRNTLLYRLEKIAKLSGKRVREPAQAIEMYLACLTDVLQENTRPAREP